MKKCTSELPLFIKTPRLKIKPLNLKDGEFIVELLNTEGWIKFIGNRNRASQHDALAHIQKILDNKNIFYWMVQLKDTLEKIGLVTFIKRDYSSHHDIGFAFLPGFQKMGYAYEATMAVLGKLISELKLFHILATTVPGNIRSINLLQKIGLTFKIEIEIEKEKLHVYAMSIDESRGKPRLYN